ncbi:MAG: transglutaminase domain-containing protein [Candidatus Micrarchaeota archaeon]|nr:transglutaminase domain-containing protein [Candidatus Micrarchaeota archaeon]
MTSRYAYIFIVILGFFVISGCVGGNPKTAKLDMKYNCTGYCAENRCDGHELYKCVLMEDGCRRESYVGISIGDCGVECIGANDYGKNFECVDYICQKNKEEMTNEKQYTENISDFLIIKFDKSFNGTAILRNKEEFIIKKIENGNMILEDKTYCNVSGTKNLTIMLGNDEEMPFYWDLTDISCKDNIIYLDISDEDIKEINKPIQERWPHNLITSNKVSKYISHIKFTNNSIDDLKTIQEFVDSRIRYRFDSIVGSEWESANEALEKGYGDCEEWAVSFVSLAKAYNRSTRCYAMVLTHHVGAFCILGEKYGIYDQETSRVFHKNGNTEKEQKYSIKNQFTRYKHDFRMSNDKVEFIFDEDEYYSFDDEMKFFEWIIKQ